MPRVKPHAKVHVSIASHAKTAAVWADRDLRAGLVELWRIGVEKYAGKTGDWIHLNRAALHSVSGRSQFQAGVKWTSTLCELMSYPMRVQGEVVSILIRNFAKKQGFDVRNVAPPNPIPIPKPKPIPSKRRENGKARQQELVAPDGATPPPLPDWSMDLAKKLAVSVQAQRPGTAVPVTPGALARWAVVFVRLHKRGNEPEEIERRTAWIFSEENLAQGEYAMVARSPSAIAKKWDRIADGMERGKRATKANETIAERGARIGKMMRGESDEEF